MSEHSSNLSLPFIQAAQAQKHVTHNEAIELLDMVVQLTLEGVGATTPPNNAAEGQAWAIGAGATGAWAGHTGDIAAWRGGGWLIVEPKVGWRAFDKTSQTIRVFVQTGWEIPTNGTPDLDNLDGVGINASSDATNRLSISSPATLLNHEGAGHQLKINKATTAETASLLFQSNWSGRAEMGLAGNDDFSIKVSDDGGTFHEALRVDGATGQVALPKTGHPQSIGFNCRYFLYQDKRWIGHSSSSASMNGNASVGSNAEPNVDWDAKGVYLPAGTRIASFYLVGNPNSTEVQGVDLRLQFQYGPLNTGWSTSATTTQSTLKSVDNFSFASGNGIRKQVYTLDYLVPEDGYFLCNMRATAPSILTNVRYFEVAGMLNVVFPPTILP